VTLRFWVWHRNSALVSTAAITAGFIADRLLGEPPVSAHPVVGFGTLMSKVEQRIYGDTRAAGVAHFAIGVAVGVGIGAATQRVIGRSLATTAAVALAVAGKMLADEASVVGLMLERGDLLEARERVVSLVGRSTEELNESEITRAVVESLAENTVDAVISSLFWAAIGGAPLVLAHRAINTLDAMVGHHSPRYENFGLASARLDDVANWIPARAGAIAVMALHPSRAHRIATVVRRDASRHPSPNGGVIEAAFAEALGIRLGGANSYGGVVEERGLLGDGRPAEVSDIKRAVAISRRISFMCALMIPTVFSGHQFVKQAHRVSGER
jgi:adenosylcobinamide-phosphate synthase